MKVETDLKAGATLQDVAQSTSQAMAPVSDFFSKASDQAQSMTSTVANKATSFWNCLKGA
jgi:hypothetical protein